MKIHITKQTIQKEVTIALPASKSISNRVLIIQSLCASPFAIKNLSTANDTLVLQRALALNSSTIDIEDTGTAARFILPYLCMKEGEWILKGTNRMHQRPIQPLVEALQQMGALINYLDEPGQLPLSIKGGSLKGGKVTVNASLSSQFVSALLLIAPALAEGISLEVIDLNSSKPYLDMTLEVIKYFGIEVNQFQNTINIAPQKYKETPITIESDWSAASYYFFAAGLIPNARIQLDNLSVYSWQGDMICSFLSSLLGSETHLLGDNIAVRNEKNSLQNFEFDFRNQPDLLMTFAVWCAALKIDARFEGIDNLAHKESDRLTSLQRELQKINCLFYPENKSWILKPDKDFDFGTTIQFNSHQDHRIAMALAPLSVIMNGMMIEDAEVVNKSFPRFWQEWEKLGFTISVLAT
jgi:3-phosphoshikimate 1-carboxyvinyltransferase